MRACLYVRACPCVRLCCSACVCLCVMVCACVRREYGCVRANSVSIVFGNCMAQSAANYFLQHLLHSCAGTCI